MSILFRRVYWAADDEAIGGAVPAERNIKALRGETDALQQLMNLREKASKKRIRNAEAEVAQNKITLDQLTRIQESEESALKIAERNAAAIEVETDVVKKRLLLLDEQIRVEEELGEVSAKAVEDLKKWRDAFKEASEDGETFANALLGVADGAKRNEKLLKLMEGGLEGLTAGFTKNINMANLADSAFTSLALKTFELAMAQDKAIAGFRQATGAGAQYGIEIARLERLTFAAGVTVEDAAKAYQELYTSFNDFTRLSEGERLQLAETVTLTEKLGINAGVSAKILDQATKSLGMNVNQANDLLLDIASTAQQVGKSTAQVAQDFAVVATKLAFYGDRITGVFQKLEMQSKATGLGINELLSLVGQFDTFEGAGKAVGRLNAIMGGPYLNSIDLLNASEEERIEILQRSMKMAGMSFDQMGKYEQLAIASALGVTAEEARKLFGNVTAEMKLQRMEEEALAKQAAEVQDIMSQLKSAMMALAQNMRPLIEDQIKPFINNLSEMASYADGLGGKIMFWGGAFLYAATKLKILLPLLKLMNGNLATTMYWLAPIVAGFAAFAFFKDHMAPLPAVLLAIAAAAAVLAIALSFATAGSSAAAALPWAIGIAAGAAAAGLGALWGTGGLKSQAPKETGTSARGRFSGQEFAAGGTVKREYKKEGTRAEVGMITPMGSLTKFSESGHAEFGITPAGTTFASAHTVNNLIDALNKNSEVTQQVLRQMGQQEGGGPSTVVLQMGRNQVTFDKAVVDAAWKSPAAKKAVGALQG